MHTVRVHAKRPDFRVIIDLVYGLGRNVDTEGDSIPVNSRDWTWLYLKDRESNDPALEVHVDDSDASVFVVISESAVLEELVALYLYIYCGRDMSRNGSFLNPDVIERLKLKYTNQLERAACSAWHRSSDAQPYPIVT